MKIYRHDRHKCFVLYTDTHTLKENQENVDENVKC